MDRFKVNQPILYDVHNYLTERCSECVNNVSIFIHQIMTLNEMGKVSYSEPVFLKCFCKLSPDCQIRDSIPNSGNYVSNFIIIIVNLW